jgi:hypothetical protein
VFLSVWGNHGPTIVFKVDGPRRIYGWSEDKARKVSVPET